MRQETCSGFGGDGMMVLVTVVLVAELFGNFHQRREGCDRVEG